MRRGCVAASPADARLSRRDERLDALGVAYGPGSARRPRPAPPRSARRTARASTRTSSPSTLGSARAAPARRPARRRSSRTRARSAPAGGARLPSRRRSGGRRSRPRRPRSSRASSPRRAPRVRGGEVAVAVLDPVQVLDQQVAPPRLLAEQRAHLGERRAVDAAALRRGPDFLESRIGRGHLQPVVHRELAYHAASTRRH